ncbi:uncharacterized protein [Hoplias malabaricus]|uniref:uncharacterized protein isoform X2 n=1 Tax=Hoplias malabaricus TaxID=27720 RepID=UPI00346268C1
MASFNASVSGETKSKIALEDEKWTRNQTAVSKFEDEGFHLAVLASIISLAIIIFMSIIFITSCLLKCVRKDEKRRMERKRKKEAAEYWQQMDQQEMRETFYRHKGRNNNNNNSRPQQHTQHSNHQSANNVQPQSLCYVEDAYRFHQQDYPLTVPTNQPPLEVMPPTSFINTQVTCVLQPFRTHITHPLPCSGYDPTSEQLPQKQSIPTLVVTEGTAISGVSGQSLKDPFWKGQQKDPKSPPIWVISV